jgi:hypothetical protein
MSEATGQEAVVLETVAVGPPVASLRGAWEALRCYAAQPATAPRPAPLDRVLWGAGVSLAAARLVASDRELRRAALLPTVITAAGCAVMAAVATFSASPQDRHAGATFGAFLVTFVALASMPPTVLQRQWIRVANQARRALGQPAGEDPFPGESFTRMLWREGLKAVRQSVAVAASLVPFLALLKLLPLASGSAAVAAGIWGFYWVVVDAFELPMEVVPGPRHGARAPWFARFLVACGDSTRWLRPLGWGGRLLTRLTRPWSEELNFTERYPMETLGFGLVVGSVLVVPVLGLCFRSVAVTAAAALLGRLGEAGGEVAPPAVASPLDTKVAASSPS